MDTQHPFAQYIRTLGRGKKGSRALTQDEAYEAMRMILADEVEPEQLGAFLMLVRVKEESPEEVAGFVQAVRETLPLPTSLPTVDIDWSSYAGKRRHLPWFVLSILLLADNGYRIFIHGLEGKKDDRIYTPEVLRFLGIPISQSLEEAAQRLETGYLAYLNLAQLSPRLQQIIDLRNILGLRSPVHTLSRMINPFAAPTQMQGIFHPGYLAIHQQAAKLLEQPHMVVIKGEGGEIEASPDTSCTLYSCHEGTLSEEEWPALLEGRRVKPTQLDLDELPKLWRGTQENAYGEAAIINTTAITLATMKQLSRQEAIETARALWQSRAKSLI